MIASTQQGDISLALLREIRDLMAAPESAETKLNAVVSSIATRLKSEVCSVYVLRAGDVLELFANVGLNPSSIHSARLNVGQGLVGDIAAHGTPLNLEDAQNHPSFVYLPITGEELFRSFLGVPIIRGGRIIGVLVVQGRDARRHSDVEVELMQTIAMVVAELVGSGELIERDELQKGTSARLFPQKFNGVKLSPGMARGLAVIHDAEIQITRFVSDDADKELERLDEALDHMRKSLDDMMEDAQLSSAEDLSEIMEAYRMFAYDQGWVKKIREVIHSGLTAEAAVKMVKDQLRVRFEKTSSDYLRERMRDIEDLSNRLQFYLSGGVGSAKKAINHDFILIARNLGPAELLDYDRERLKGLVLEDGSATSHVVIIARAIDIPVVGRVNQVAAAIGEGEKVIVNGDDGEVYLNPHNEVEQAIAHYLREKRERRSRFAAISRVAPVTRDGVRVMINMNAGLFIDLNQLHEAGADGIGLYRTELPYMMAKNFPSAESQAEIYGQVLDQAQGKRVIFRTFDIGGDKQVHYIHTPHEENPAMGWRATRIALDRPSILLRQLRALIKAGAGRSLDVMFPFIATTDELLRVKAMLMEELAKSENPPATVRCGTMIEVPSILWQLDALLPHVEFVSVGSNDLMQFLFACDRGSTTMADRYDQLCPGMLNVLEYIITTCDRHGVEAGFCGEMASRPLDAMCLLALGYRSLSMPASSIPNIRAMVSTLDLGHFRQFLGELRQKPRASYRSLIRDYAADRGIAV